MRSITLMSWIIILALLPGCGHVDFPHVMPMPQAPSLQEGEFVTRKIYEGDELNLGAQSAKVKMIGWGQWYCWVQLDTQPPVCLRSDGPGEVCILPDGKSFPGPEVRIWARGRDETGIWVLVSVEGGGS
ncbi:MAG: hypothetical protein DRI01_10625 [Chloroflexi bacterium]|nr:MAG: hypothetical protein DRI01_10625 [Chloroflexota bacterium]